MPKPTRQMMFSTDTTFSTRLLYSVRAISSYRSVFVFAATATISIPEKYEISAPRIISSGPKISPFAETAYGNAMVPTSQPSLTRPKGSSNQRKNGPLSPACSEFSLSVSHRGKHDICKLLVSRRLAWTSWRKRVIAHFS